TPAPCRFLPEFDNLLLSHADRRRVAPGRTPDPWTGSVLVDGVVAGQWRYRNDRGDAHLAVRLFDRPVRSTRDEIEGEAGRLARFLAPEGVDPDLRIEDPSPQRAMYPPPMQSSDPVMKASSSLAMNATPAAISSGRPSLPIGVIERMASSNGVPRASSRIGVSTNPGWTELTRISSWAQWRATFLVRIL